MTLAKEEEQNQIPHNVLLLLSYVTAPMSTPRNSRVLLPLLELVRPSPAPQLLPLPDDGKGGHASLFNLQPLRLFFVILSSTALPFLPIHYCLCNPWLSSLCNRRHQAPHTSDDGLHSAMTLQGDVNSQRPQMRHLLLHFLGVAVEG